MMNRLGIILIVSGFLLLGYRQFLSPEVIKLILDELITNWPIFLIVIGFILSMPKKKRKSQR